MNGGKAGREYQRWEFETAIKNDESLSLPAAMLAMILASDFPTTSNKAKKMKAGHGARLVSTLVRETKMGRSTIFRAAAELEAAGFLERTERRDGRKQLATEYVLKVPDAPPSRSGTGPVAGPPQSRSGTPPVPERDPPRPAAGHITESLSTESFDTEKTPKSGPLAFKKMPTGDIDEAVGIWNALADECGLAKVQRMNDARKRSLRKRLGECGGIDGWQFACDQVRQSSFLRGETARGNWKASFDFLIRASSFTKVMEGVYDKDHRQPDWDDSDPPF